jgi:formate hydrogenlyase transcriptional activator
MGDNAKKANRGLPSLQESFFATMPTSKAVAGCYRTFLTQIAARMNNHSTNPPELRATVQGLTQQLRASQDRFRLVVKLGRVVNSSLDLRKVFRHAARGIRPLFRCDYIGLFLIHRESSSFAGFAVVYDDKMRWEEIPAQSLAGSMPEWIQRHRRSRIVKLESTQDFGQDRQQFAAGHRACVDIPLICHDSVVGVLQLAVRDSAAVDRWDFELLGELGNVLATALNNAAAYTQITELKAQLERENRYLRNEVANPLATAGLEGLSNSMEEVHQAIAQVAPTESTVLILGETGVGKELVARSIHESSPRRDRLLVKVNCAALAPGVLTSELFGHEAGAFTGATQQRIGRFELAHCGSLFLDEIAEMPADAQVLLLRVLQERVLERVGGHEPIPVDVRVIAATNRDLTAAVQEGRFRADLFYRLNVFPLQVPPLRDRKADIPALVEHFLQHLRRRVNKPFCRVTQRTLDLLAAYHWPGNVRELENIVERGLIISRGDTLEIDPTWLAGSPSSEFAASSLAEQERRAILDALHQSKGRVYGPGGAATLLGLKPSTLYGKMRKHAIRKSACAD